MIHAEYKKKCPYCQYVIDGTNGTTNCPKCGRVIPVMGVVRSKQEIKSKSWV